MNSMKTKDLIIRKRQSSMAKKKALKEEIEHMDDKQALIRIKEHLQDAWRSTFYIKEDEEQQKQNNLIKL